MRLRVTSRFPTLVLTIVVTILSLHATRVFAATNSPSPDFVDPAPVEPPPTSQQEAFRSSTDISAQLPAAPAAARRLGYFHNYRNALSAMASYGLDTQRIRYGEGALTRVGLLYLYQVDPVHAYEAEANLLSDGSGSLSAAYRWIFSRDRFRPYTKAGIGARIEPRDQLATFLRLRHYRLIGAAGFERNISTPLSFRLETQAGLSTELLEVCLGVGLVWSW